MRASAWQHSVYIRCHANSHAMRVSESAITMGEHALKHIARVALLVPVVFTLWAHAWRHGGMTDHMSASVLDARFANKPFQQHPAAALKPNVSQTLAALTVVGPRNMAAMFEVACMAGTMDRPAACEYKLINAHVSTILDYATKNDSAKRDMWLYSPKTLTTKNSRL